MLGGDGHLRLRHFASRHGQGLVGETAHPQDPGIGLARLSRRPAAKQHPMPFRLGPADGFFKFLLGRYHPATGQQARTHK